jgi:HK97 family phage portal protein
VRLPFGFEVVKRAAVSPVNENRGGWWPVVREPYSGAWQQGQKWSAESVLAHHAVYTCVTLIASDIGKLRQKLVQRGGDGIWSEVTAQSPFAAVLRKPNRYQNHIQFKEWWITSKLLRGNTYVLKERDGRGVVRALYILDPSRVKVLVAEDGAVFYQLSDDNLSGLVEPKTVPASEIIHDRINCLYHPLVGVSPIYASGSAADVGLKIQANSAGFFGNGSNPSGILTAPETIPQEVADRLRDHWDKNYSGDQAGKVAVLGNGLKFEPMRMSAVDAQMIEHLKWTAETVCATFHVPAFKVGVGAMPTYQNGEVLNQIYYSDCLQSHIEQYEVCMDDGLGLDDPKEGRLLGVELELETLLRMDTATQVKTLAEGIKGSLLTPNEARRSRDLPPLEGGDTVYMQQQNYSLSALDARDRAAPAPSARDDRTDATPLPAPELDNTEDQARAYFERRFHDRWSVAA